MARAASRGTPGTAAVPSARIPVLECGRIARDTLATGADGVVCATFRRSCYLEFAGRRTICVGERALGRGPLNVRIDAFEPPGLGEVLGLSADDAAVWQPPIRLARPRRAALEALRAAAHTRIPTDGLGGLVCGVSGPLIEHARPALTALERWQAGGVLSRDVEMLLGLGPGLTPSGDDYLGGVLVALHLFGRTADADALWAWLGPRLPARTSLISAAHLAAAAEGEAHEALHASLDALSEGLTTGWHARLEWLAAVGHCSGWDGLAGAMAVAQRVAV